MEKKLWLIGHNDDLSLVILGEDTGPYSQVPDTGTGYGVRGQYVMITNNGWNYCGTFRAPAIDKLQRREPNADEPFNSVEEVKEYMDKVRQTFWVGGAYATKFPVENKHLFN